MKKFRFEITVEAHDESEAESKMRGLGLLTNCLVVQVHDADGILPLDEQEKGIIRLHRRGKKVFQILKSCMENPKRIDDLADHLEGKQ